MIAIILAGGYGKRLQPLTRDKPKALLLIAGKPILKYILEKIGELDVYRIILSANMRFKLDFEYWLKANGYGEVEVIADESYREEEKPGAVKALAELTKNLSDDCLIIAGDNLFTDSLRGMVEAYGKVRTPMIALYDIGSLELARNYSTVIVDRENRVLSLKEKPLNPETTLIGTCIYILPRKTLPKIREYVNEGLGVDEPGRFIEWLHKKVPVYGYLLRGKWWDIGTIESYNSANEFFRKLK